MSLWGQLSSIRANVSKLAEELVEELNEEETVEERALQLLQESREEADLLREELSGLQTLFADTETAHREEVEDIQRRMEQCTTDAEQRVAAAEKGAAKHRRLLALEQERRQQLEQDAGVSAEDTATQDAWAQTVSLLDGTEDVPAAIEELLARLGSTEAALEAEKTKAQALELEKEDSDRRADAHKETLRRAKERYEGLTERFANLQAECRKAYDRVHDMGLEVEQRDVQIQEHKEMLLTMQEQVTRLEEEMDHAEADLEQAQHDVAEKQAVVRSLSEQMEERVRHEMAREAEENDRLKRLARELDYVREENAALREQEPVEGVNTEEVETLQQALKDAEMELHQLKREATAMEGLSADYAALRRQCDALEKETASKETSLHNLELALAQIQQEEAASRAALQDRVAELESQLMHKEEEAAHTESLLADRVRFEASVKQLQTEVESCRAYIDKLERDNGSTRKTLQETLHQLHHMDQDENLVDRRVVSQLLVQYLEGKRTDDVVDLMSKILQFTPEQRQRVGAESSSSNLADLWVDFLLEEAAQ